jgi:ABC-type transport system involved in cytochrome bd biosynthesis fused ATPase/permease subunit
MIIEEVFAYLCVIILMIVGAMCIAFGDERAGMVAISFLIGIIAMNCIEILSTLRKGEGKK